MHYLGKVTNGETHSKSSNLLPSDGAFFCIKVKEMTKKHQIKMEWSIDTGPCDLDNEHDESHEANENGTFITVGNNTIFLCDRHSLQVLVGLEKIYRYHCKRVDTSKDRKK